MDNLCAVNINNDLNTKTKSLSIYHPTASEPNSSHPD